MYIHTFICIYVHTYVYACSWIFSRIQTTTCSLVVLECEILCWAVEIRMKLHCSHTTHQSMSAKCMNKSFFQCLFRLLLFVFLIQAVVMILIPYSHTNIFRCIRNMYNLGVLDRFEGYKFH